MSDELVRVDFEKIYTVYLDNLAQKASLFKLLISFVVAPYVVAIAFLSTKALKFSQLSDLGNLPGFLDFVILIVGLGLLLPLFQYIEYDDNVMRTARSINHFRALYVNALKDAPWRPNLPTSSLYPVERRLTSSGSVLVVCFMCVSVVYVVKGAAGLTGVDPLGAVTIGIGVVGFVALSTLYLRTGHNPLYDPIADALPTPVWVDASDPGRAWRDYLAHVCRHGRPVADDKGTILEAPPIAVTVKRFADDDAIVREHGDPRIRELYTRKMFSLEVIPELNTTYGDRLFGYDGRDQIAGAIEKLRADPASKSATVTLLDPLERWPERRMPCLTVVDLKVRDDQLHVYAFFRSQNALNAYGNMYGLWAIQRHCAQALEVGEGSVTLFVSSPHVYEADLDAAQRVVQAS